MPDFYERYFQMLARIVTAECLVRKLDGAQHDLVTARQWLVLTDLSDTEHKSLLARCDLLLEELQELTAAIVAHAKEHAASTN